MRLSRSLASQVPNESFIAQMSYREFTSQGEYELPELSDPQNPLLPQCFGNKEDSLYKLPWSGASLWFSAMYPPNLFVDGFRVALVGARVPFLSLHWSRHAIQ